MRCFICFILILICQVVGAQNHGMEVPKTKLGDSEIVVSHEGYTLSFNPSTNCPNWVSWELTSTEVQDTVGRTNEFAADPLIPAEHRVESYDYRGSGYDRGHMCPAADMKWSQTAMQASFYMSNMCPQDRSLNGGPWEKLESACRRWARQEGSVYIVCGPIFNYVKTATTIGVNHQVRVPEAFFKVVLSLKSGQEKAIGFYYTNDNSRQTMTSQARSVDEIEKLTGYDFFPLLSKKLEKQLESTFNLSKWK